VTGRAAAAAGGGRGAISAGRPESGTGAAEEQII